MSTLSDELNRLADRLRREHGFKAMTLTPGEVRDQVALHASDTTHIELLLAWLARTPEAGDRSGGRPAKPAGVRVNMGADGLPSIGLAPPEGAPGPARVTPAPVGPGPVIRVRGPGGYEDARVIGFVAGMYKVQVVGDTSWSARMVHLDSVHPDDRAAAEEAARGVKAAAASALRKTAAEESRGPAGKPNGRRWGRPKG